MQYEDSNTHTKKTLRTTRMVVTPKKKRGKRESPAE